MTDSKYPFADPAVEKVFEAFPASAREGLLRLRGLIFDIAAETDGVGPLQECLKWGQPAYLTPKSKSGTTIRLGKPKQGGFALYTHCQTTVMAEMRDLFPDDFTFEGNRAVHFAPGDDLPMDKLTILIRRALTYHL